tara:strand:+ start:75 stop:398 length:324 start_codon:yes stop_codon:yes gene_type:complete
MSIKDRIKKSKLVGEQKVHVILSFVLNLLALILVIASPASFIIKLFVVVIYVPYSYYTGKYISAFYKLVTPQRQWLTKSSFAHHASKIFGLVITTVIFFFLAGLLAN